MALATDLTIEDEGGEIRFDVRTRNTGDEPVDVTFRTGQVVDVVVYADAEPDTVAWQWSEDKLFTQEISTETLDPGDAIEETVTWAEPAPGSYTAVGRLAADVDAEARTTFSV